MKSAKFHINAMSLYRNTVKKQKYRQKILKKWLYRNLTSDLWPLTFTSGNLADTSFNPGLHSHQVWKRSVQPTRRSRSHKFPLFSSFFRLKIHTSPSITWRLMPVAMVTIYFGSSSHPHDTCKVSCQCDVPLQKYCKNMIFTKFDLWPLTFDLCFRQWNIYNGST